MLTWLWNFCPLNSLKTSYPLRRRLLTTTWRLVASYHQLLSYLISNVNTDHCISLVVLEVIQETSAVDDFTARASKDKQSQERQIHSVLEGRVSASLDNRRVASAKLSRDMGMYVCTHKIVLYLDYLDHPFYNQYKRYLFKLGEHWLASFVSSVF